MESEDPENAISKLACVASTKGKEKGGGEERRLGRREGKGALATKARITPCFYVQNLDVKCRLVETCHVKL